VKRLSFGIPILRELHQRLKGHAPQSQVQVHLARAIDQNASHDERGEGEQVGLVLKMDGPIAPIDP